MNDSAAPLTQAELDDFAALWNAGPTLQYLGFRLSFPEGARAVIELPRVKPEQRGGLGTDAVNGGILAAMFDFAIGCTSLLAPPQRRSATVQLNMQFERAVRGDSARCEAIIERATPHLLFVSARMLDGSNVVCSKGTGLVSLGKEISLEDWSRQLAGANT